MVGYLENFKQSDGALNVPKDCRHKIQTLDTSQQYQFQLKSSMAVTFDWKYFCLFCSSKSAFLNKDRNKPRRVRQLILRTMFLWQPRTAKMSDERRYLEELQDVMIWLQRTLCIIQHAWQSLARKPIQGRLVVQLVRKKHVLLKCCVNNLRRKVTVICIHCRTYSQRWKNETVETQVVTLKNRCDQN